MELLANTFGIIMELKWYSSTVVMYKIIDIHSHIIKEMC